MTRPCPPTPEHLRLAPGGEASWTQAYEMLARLVELARDGARGEDLHLFVAHALLRARSEGTHPNAPGMPQMPFEAAVTDPGAPRVEPVTLIDLTDPDRLSVKRGLTFDLFEPGRCIFRHGTPDDPINTLYNVHPMPVADLPRECACGAVFHYADEVRFVGGDAT